MVQFSLFTISTDETKQKPKKKEIRLIQVHLSPSNNPKKIYIINSRFRVQIKSSYEQEYRLFLMKRSLRQMGSCFLLVGLPRMLLDAGRLWRDVQRSHVVFRFVSPPRTDIVYSTVVFFYYFLCVFCIFKKKKRLSRAHDREGNSPHSPTKQTPDFSIITV